MKEIEKYLNIDCDTYNVDIVSVVYAGNVQYIDKENKIVNLKYPTDEYSDSVAIHYICQIPIKEWT